jgi:hypothetical protein
MKWMGHRHTIYISYGIRARFIKNLEVFFMGKALKMEKLEELRDCNRHIQEKSWYWRKKVNELEK